MKMVVIKNSDSDEQNGYIKLSSMTSLASKQFTNTLKLNGLQSSALANMWSIKEIFKAIEIKNKKKGRSFWLSLKILTTVSSF